MRLASWLKAQYAARSTKNRIERVRCAGVHPIAGARQGNDVIAASGLYGIKSLPGQIYRAASVAKRNGRVADIHPHDAIDPIAGDNCIVRPADQDLVVPVAGDDGGNEAPATPPRAALNSRRRTPPRRSGRFAREGGERPTVRLWFNTYSFHNIAKCATN